jgi:hypothetical protein
MLRKEVVETLEIQSHLCDNSDADYKSSAQKMPRYGVFQVLTIMSVQLAYPTYRVSGNIEDIIS